MCKVIGWIYFLRDSNICGKVFQPFSVKKPYEILVQTLVREAREPKLGYDL